MMRAKIPCGLRQAGGLRRVHPAGLTLIELLVVIASIAMLAAIILASVSRARIQPAKPQTSATCTRSPGTSPLPDIARNNEKILSLYWKKAH